MISKCQFATLLTLSISFYIAGCSSFSSSSGNIPGNHINGLLYYLPEGRIRIVGTSSSATQTGTTPTQSASAQPGDTSNPKDTGQQNNQGKSGSYTINISADIRADPSAHFYLKPDINILYDDQSQVGINAKHLLNSGSVTSTDETAQILGTFAQFTESIFNPLAGAHPLRTVAIENLNNLISTLEHLQAGQKELNSVITLPNTTIKLLADLLQATDAYPKDANEQANIAGLVSASLLKPSLDLSDIISFLKHYLVNVQLKSKQFDALCDIIEQNLNPITTPSPFSVVFDPENDTDILRARAIIKACGFELHVYKDDDAPTLFNQEVSKQLVKNCTGNVVDGIAYRPVRPYLITLQSNLKSIHMNEEQRIFLPDKRHLAIYDYPRLSFVTATTNIQFTDGIAMTYSRNRPSQFLGFLGIPKAIINALIPNPLSPPSSSPQGTTPTSSASGPTKK